MAKKHYIVKHILPDGSRPDSVKGMIIPVDSIVYDIFRKVNEDRMEVMTK